MPARHALEEPDDRRPQTGLETSRGPANGGVNRVSVAPATAGWGDGGRAADVDAIEAVACSTWPSAELRLPTGWGSARPNDPGGSGPAAGRSGGDRGVRPLTPMR
jgi:hypothetical protein